MAPGRGRGPSGPNTGRQSSASTISPLAMTMGWGGAVMGLSADMRDNMGLFVAIYRLKMSQIGSPHARALFCRGRCGFADPPARAAAKDGGRVGERGCAADS